MHRTFALLMAALVIGCGDNQGLHGTSTKKASIKPVQPTVQPAKSATRPAQQAEAPPAAAKFATYGEPLKLSESETISVTDVAASGGTYDGKYVRLTGVVTKVCPHKGCWFEMADCEDNADVIFVKFPDPESGKLIASAAVGKTVVAEGIVRFREISEDQAKHYKEEAGATPEQLAKIVGPQKQLILTTPRAQITGVAN